MPFPPQYKTFTADNVTGAAITPISTCTIIVVGENSQLGTDDYTIDSGSGPITRPAGSRTELKPQRGNAFPAGVSTGITVKRATAGTLTFAQEEYGD